MKLLLIALICLLAFATADPEPTGGANCTYDTDCGGAGAGDCIPYKTPPPQNSTYNGTCVCPDSLANPDCSYQRTSKSLAGGLQFLCFVGIGGVGNFVLGRIGPAVGQLLLMLATIFISVAGCVSFCVGSIKAKLGVGLFAGLACIIISIALTGFIWSIVDGADILQGKIADGNGYATY
jgi:hypothetical protein